MHRVALVVKSQSILDGIISLNYWGKSGNFEIGLICDNLSAICSQSTNDTFELLIVETQLAESDNYALLEKIMQDGLCHFVALCDSTGDFPSARKAIQLGVAEYFTLPFSEIEIISFLERIHSSYAIEKVTVEEHYLTLRKKIENRALGSMHRYLAAFYEQDILPPALNRIVTDIFRENEWLDLYMEEKDFFWKESRKAHRQTELFEDFLNKYLKLYPPHNESLKPIIQYILYYPEDDLRQKSVAGELNISASYLSMAFTAQTGIRYVDYVSYVKLMRSAWLLKNTTLKIGEIAARLFYKDTIYFSRQFKKLFHITPSEYRIPDEYRFDI